MQTGNTDIIYKYNLDKACFQQNLVYGKYKDLAKRTQSNKVLRDKAFEIADNPKYIGYQRGLASIVYMFFDNKCFGRGVIFISNYHLSNELHKQIIRKLKRQKVCSSFKDNIWCADLADRKWLSKYSKEIKYLLSVIDLFSKYAIVVLINDKKQLLLLMHLKRF